VTDVLVTNVFGRFGVPIELHSNQGRNFESRLMQEDLERRDSKSGTIPLRPQSDGMVERYVKTIEKHEFYEYEVTQYDPPTGKGGNFVQYIDKFLKSKVEGSGSPGWVQTPEDEDKFVKYFLEEGH